MLYDYSKLIISIRRHIHNKTSKNEYDSEKALKKDLKVLDRLVKNEFDVIRLLNEINKQHLKCE